MYAFDMVRPKFITVICWLGFIGVILTPILLLNSSLSPVGGSAPTGLGFPAWYVILSLFFLIPYLFALVDIWKMRKRGIELYTATAIAEHTVGFVAGFASIVGLLISIILIGLIWVYYKKMTEPSFLGR